ncbi:hypothetical protein THAR02_01014 [Trichoderma harzianum]|uniref:Xylanolytic transcriptional activator regulatory domain-containing protein n=1 Tax=Trichoderma harzianum TaxID=5544 RepID=A0A0F9Y4C2_TRIHA|nr:hypothetical protein THAR02_01014 [Trichoderma harzianum]
MATAKANFHIQCKDVPTGTLLQPVHDGSIPGAEQGLTRQRRGPLTPSDTRDDIQDTPAEAGHAADIGMLALNATGEMRYLGPSSGAFFAAYTSALARSCITTQSSPNTTSSTQNANSGRNTETSFVSPTLRLSSSDVNLFSQSYKMWILPVYPVLTSDDLDKMVSRYIGGPDLDNSECRRQPETATEMMLFYLVMALGAINAENTLKQMRGQPEQEEMFSISTPRPSPVSLCMRVLQLMDENFQKLHPSVRLIQIIVLIAIYSSYGSIGSSQWQLAGLAMRSCWAKDESNRLFWTIYIVEISLAYNLGRPPSIGEEHIATELPRPSNENLLSLHHIRHRQIQSRVVAQQELDEWRINIPLTSHAEGQHPYPYSITSHTMNASSRSPAFSTNPDVAENALGSDQNFTADASDFNLNLTEDLNYFDIFKEFMGQDPTQTFWDMFPYELSLDATPDQPVTEEGLPSINSTKLLTNELFK